MGILSINQAYEVLFNKLFKNQPLSDEERIFLLNSSGYEDEYAAVPDLCRLWHAVPYRDEIVSKAEKMSRYMSLLDIQDVFQNVLKYSKIEARLYPQGSTESTRRPDKVEVFEEPVHPFYFEADEGKTFDELFTDEFIEKMALQIAEVVDSGLFTGNDFMDGVLSDRMTRSPVIGLNNTGGHVIFNPTVPQDSFNRMMFYIPSPYRRGMRFFIDPDFKAEIHTLLYNRGYELNSLPVVEAKLTDQYPLVLANLKAYTVGRGSLDMRYLNGRYEFRFGLRGVMNDPRAFRILWAVKPEEAISGFI